MDEHELTALIREADNIDQGAAAHAQAAAEGNIDDKGQIVVPAPVDRAAQWMIIPQTLAWAITAAMPETAEAYTEAKCRQLAEAFVPVADKYGWDGIGDAPELTLLLCGVGFMAPGFLAYRARKAVAVEAEAKADAEKGPTFANPINGTVA